jgi:hypothetical protein
MVPGCLQVLRLSLPDAKVIFINCFGQLVNLHREEHTLNGKLDATIFMVWLSDNKVTMHIQNEEDKLTYSEKGGDADYTSFVKAIKSLYHGKPIPMDVSKWLEVISKGVAYCRPELIANNFAMLDDIAAFGAFQSMYHTFLEFEQDRNTDFWDMVDSPVMQKYKVWRLNFVQCSYLRKTYYWQDKFGNRVHYEANVKGILRLVRNCWEHPAKLIQGFLVSILLATLPDLLSDVQKALSDAGYLKHLRM